jgi:hypothetical protein
MIGSWVLFGQGFCRGWGQDPWTMQPDSRESTEKHEFSDILGSGMGKYTINAYLYNSMALILCIITSRFHDNIVSCIRIKASAEDASPKEQWIETHYGKQNELFNPGAVNR